MSENLGELQLEVMEVVWSLGSGTVAEVHQELLQKRALAYTTVLTTLRGLERRGYLGHTAEGKAHRFHPRVSRDEHTSARVDHLVSTLFGGRPERLMSHLLGGGEIDEAQLRRVRELVERAGEEE